MASVWKRVRKYERWVLIGIVILMLATFSITGSVQGCGGASGQVDAYGGSYEPVPGRREDVSGIEFMALRARYAPIALSEIWGPTIRYASEVAGTQRSARLNQDLATWAHLVVVGAANAAGYHVGTTELREGIETMVLRAVTRRDPRESGVRFSPELYDQVVARFYPLPKADFETTVREILLKDKFLADVIDSQRFSRDPEDAYASWKAERERVDLAYFAVPAAQFKDAVELEEKTRTAVARQSELWHQVVRAALEVRRLQGVLKDWQKANGGAAPANAQEFLEKEPAKTSLQGGKMPKDSWGHELVYVASGETSGFHSMGPDGKDGTPDDVGVAVLDTLQTMGALRRVGDGLETWMAAAKSWPASLTDLTKAPPAEAGKPAPPPPLNEVPKDSWGHDLAYVAGGPELSSLGADGAAGTPDDLRVQFADGKAHVGVPDALKVFVLEDAKDAWARALLTELRSANPLLFETVSAGPDGKDGNDDDVATGNSTDLLVYFNGVRTDYGLPQRREFEALYVVPALVSDETFGQAWKKFPDLRPDEKAAWDLFRSSGIYRTRDEAPLARPGEPAPEKPQDKDIDPADPEKGYAARYLTSLREAKRLPKEAKGWQVPAPETLGDRKDAPAAGTPEAAGLPMPEVDPLYKTYLDKGWRRVVLRDLFFDNLLSAALKTSREAAEAKAKWEKEGKAGTAPPLVSLAETLAKYADLQPGEADSAAGARFLQFVTKAGEPLSREELEKLPDLGHYLLGKLLPSKDDEYAQIPVQIQDDGALRAALHSIKMHAPKQQELAEVRDKVWPKYLESRTMERASKELDRIRTEVGKQSAPGADGTKPPPETTPEARLALVEKLLKDAAESRKFTYTTGRTGPFRGGAHRSRTVTPDPTATEDAKKALAERAFTRAYGYDVVRTSGSGQGAKALEVGTIGRTVLRDDRGPDVTGEAYLVQVAWRQDPPPEEFTGRQYLQWLARAAYDQHEEWTPTQEALTHRAGFMLRAMSVGYDDIDRLKAMFSIRTPTPLEMPKNTN